MPHPLDYAPPDPPREAVIDVLLKVFLIIGITVVLFGSITLDGGKLYFLASLGFGGMLSVLGIVAMAIGPSPRRMIRPIALAIGIAMLCMAFLPVV